MARKFIKKWMPDPAKIRTNPALHFLGDLLHDPNLFHLNRHSVSVAFFVGIFTAFLPIPGQMPAAALLALLARCNLPLAVALVWISNPLTIAPIFYASYKLGSLILQSPPVEFTIELSWDWFITEFQHLWQPLIVGSLISGLFFGGLGYITMQVFWRRQVLKNWRRRKRERAQKKPE
jgi:uncharacterized protein (DUF2062 family)